jgi:decaprenylphospho-beta-D-ribofuranose 2-oxidase
MQRNDVADNAGPPRARAVLHSFDGGIQADQEVMRPEKFRDLEALGLERLRIARGGGYSYAAASFGDGAIVQSMQAFDRILEFDETNGIIECEAGITLGKLYDFLAPRGWCLRVQPGYPRITIGGCIAAEVHGKNQYLEGTFSRWLLSVRLFHPRHGMLEASRQVNPEIFDLTCGGLGLTGQILSARIEVQKLTTSSVRLFARRIANVSETVPILAELAESTPLLYTWHNFSVAGRGFGRGFAYGATPCPDQRIEQRNAGGTRPVDSETRERLRLQFLNRFTAGAFNRAYEFFQRIVPREQDVDLFDFLFPVARKVLFFELFGRAGFHEYQVILPIAAFDEFIKDVRAYLSRNRVGICLASGKIFRGKQSLLRFNGSGICFALDFSRDSVSGRFAAFLDELVVRIGGLPNLLKDSRLPRQVMEACYGETDSFRRRLKAYDPARLYRSESSERLGL